MHVNKRWYFIMSDTQSPRNLIKKKKKQLLHEQNIKQIPECDVSPVIYFVLYSEVIGYK